MPKWEYMSIGLFNEQRTTGLTGDKQVLDKYGLEGWELVTIIKLETTKGLELVAYLKREKI